MEPKELRAAAERLLVGTPVTDWQEHRLMIDGAEQVSHTRLGIGPSPDVAAVARAYLTEHPADDDEPLSAAWLDKCLPRSKDVGFSGEVLWQFGPFDTLSMYPEREDVARVFAREIRTRGQLRRLCAALGVPLTEPTP